MAERSVDMDLLFLLRHTRARLSDDAFAILRVCGGRGGGLIEREDAVIPRASFRTRVVHLLMSTKEIELRKGSL